MTQIRRNHAISLLEATRDSPTLAHLTHLAKESSERLLSVQPLIPAALRAAVRAGPINGDEWYLILDNTAVAAKIRQMLPSMESHLRSKGWAVNAIRLKVQKTGHSV